VESKVGYYSLVPLLMVVYIKDEKTVRKMGWDGMGWEKGMHVRANH